MTITKEKISEIIETVQSQIDSLQNDKHVIELEMNDQNKESQGGSQVQMELLHEIGIAIEQNQTVLQSFQECQELFDNQAEGELPQLSRDMIALFEFYGLDVSRSMNSSLKNDKVQDSEIEAQDTNVDSMTDNNDQTSSRNHGDGSEIRSVEQGTDDSKSSTMEGKFPFKELSISLPNVSASTSPSSVRIPITYSPRTESPSRFRSGMMDILGKEGAGALREILEEMKREASIIQSQFHNTYTNERNLLLEDLSRTKALLAQQMGIEEELKAQLKEQQERNQELELVKSKSEESIAQKKSLEDQIKILENALEELKQETEKSIQRKIEDKEQLRDHLMSTFVQESKTQQDLMNQMKNEMMRRKDAHDEQISRLKEIVTDSLNKNGNRYISANSKRLQNYAEMQLMELENASYDLRLHKTGDENDALDYAVADVINSMNLPVSVDVERIAQGEYLMDRRLTMRLINGEPMVRIGHGYEAFSSYVRNLYSPFLIGDDADEGEEEDQPNLMDGLDNLIKNYQHPTNARATPSPHRNTRLYNGGGLRSLSPRNSNMLSPRTSHLQHTTDDTRTTNVQLSQQIVREVRESQQRRQHPSPRGERRSPANALPPRSITSFTESQTKRMTTAGGQGKPVRSVRKATSSPVRSERNLAKRQTRASSSHALGEKLQSRRFSSAPRSAREQSSFHSQRSSSVGRSLKSKPQTIKSRSKTEHDSPRGTGRLLPETIGTMSEQEIRHLKRVALKKQIEQMRIRRERDSRS